MALPPLLAALTEARLAPVVTREIVLARIEERYTTRVPQDYPFPIALLRAQLDKYSIEDLQRLEADFEHIWNETFDGKVSGERTYVVTAGSPAAGKSTLLEARIKGQANLVYTDPDRSCLQKFPFTYLADTAQGFPVSEAYSKWREASIFLATVILAHAIEQGYSIAQGSTMTHPLSKNTLAHLQNRSYTRTLLHISCPDAVRFASEQARQAGGVVQVTEADFAEKGKMFYERLPDYRGHADTIIFYFRPTVDTMVKAARYTPEKGFEVKDAAAFNALRALHDAAQGEGSFAASMG